jgi:hypothetical protein
MANGNGKVVSLLVTYLMPALIAGGVARLAAVNSHSEHIAVLEALLQDTRRRLERIEIKIDRMSVSHNSR